MYRVRFFITLVKCFLTPTLKLDDTFNLSFIAIPFIDTDFSRLFTQTYSLYMGISRWHYVFHSQFRNFAIKRGWAPVTTAETIEYKKSIKAWDKVTVETKLLCWNSKRFYLSQKFLVRGNIHALCYVEGLIRGPEGILEPPRVFHAVGLATSSPSEPVEIQKWIQARQAIS